MEKTTESTSYHDHLDRMSARELVTAMNREDATVATAVERVLPVIARVVEVATDRLLSGGRLFYLGAGTSGRLGVVDASECPPTFGVSHDLVIGLIAGGDGAIRVAVEFAEDDDALGWQDLQAHDVSPADLVIGLAASGTTPYVVGALDRCRAHGITTACITCNRDTPLAQHADHAIEVVTGPEFVTGSTRLKAGTAQKMVLNMISTGAMVGIGRVHGNKMVDMRLSNEKLRERGTRMVMEATGVDDETARTALLETGVSGGPSMS